MITRTRLLQSFLTTLLLARGLVGQTPVLATPHARIPAHIDESNFITLGGNIHPLAAGASASQSADDGTPMQHMILFLKADVTQESALEQLIIKQNDPSSSLYHRYLSSTDFGAQFGVAASDIHQVISWLQSHGFTIDQVPSGSRSIVFSGTSGQVAEAFKTEIRQYTVGGISHFANAGDPQIPADLSAAVGGIVKLHDFRHGHSITKAAPVTAAQLANPAFDATSGHYLAPADYGSIYNINPLYSAGINGSGQSIAVIARSNIYLSDVQAFRSNFGLPANDPQIVITSSNPGVLQGDSVETTLDTEWSGAVAPKAAIKVIVAASTNTADGIDLSALYAVNNNVAPIISLSYGSCEAAMGSSELAFYNSLWKQAAAQGISVFVSSGDSGAAGCNGGSSTSGSGQAINGLCSSPYSTCVGGTEFVDSSNPGQYWLSGNSPTYGSAIGYIPEKVWNESATAGGSDLWAAGGGASIIYTKPSWQSGPGISADGKRDVPDVSLTAAGHDGYLIWLYGALNSVGGTSAAAPSFAGLMALVDQKAASRQGLANSILYPLATKQSSGGAAVFHDITSGNNSVPGVSGFTAGAGYDLASGLGSVDANLLVNHWADGSIPPASISLAASSTTLTIIAGQSGQTVVTSTATSLNAAVTVTVAGMPAGVTGSFVSSTIASPGSGSTSLTLVVASATQPGTYLLTITASGGSKTATLQISLVVPAPTFAFASYSTALTILPGNSGQVSVSTTPQFGFTSVITLASSGLPSGVSAAFSPASITAGASSGSSTLTVTVAKTAAPGTYPLTLTASGGGVTKNISLSLVITIPASCTLVSNPSTVTLFIGQSATSQISCGTVKGTFTGPLTLSASGAPAGVNVSLSPASLTAGSATTLNLTSLSTAAPGTYSVSVGVTGSGFTQTLSVPLTIPTPAFALSAASSSVSANLGGSAQTSITLTPQNGFNSTINLSISGLPAGVTSTFSSTTVSGAAPGTVQLTLAVPKTVKGGTYAFTISAVGGGLIRTMALSLTVIVPPVCNLVATPAAINLTAGQSVSASVSCVVVQGSFTAPLTLSVSGAPTGVTAQTTSPTLAPGSSVSLNVAGSLATAAGSYSLSLTAAGSGYSQTVSIPLTVVVPATFTATPAQNALTVKTGSSGQLSISTLRYGTFNSPISFAFTGLPVGVTATLSTFTIPAPGNGTLLATLAVSSSARPGTYSITMNATGGGQTQTALVTLTITPNADFTFSVSTAALTITRGSSGTVVVSTSNYTGGFNSTISISFAGLTAGMNWAVTGANTANNSVNLFDSFSAASYTPVGTFPLTITASGGGVSHSAVVQVTIK